MSVKITCDQCGRTYAVQPQVLGRKVKCKDCGYTFTAAEPEPQLVELVELNDLSSFDSAGLPPAEFASGGLSSLGLKSQPLATPRKPAPGGISTGVILALVASGGAVVLLCAVVLAMVLFRGGDSGPSPSNVTAGGSLTPAAAPTTSVSSTSSSSTGATLAVTGPATKPAVRWSVTPDPAPRSSQQLTSAAMPTGSFEKLFFSRPDFAAALACRVEYGKPGNLMHAEKYNLVTGQSAGGIDLPQNDRVLGFSFDGRHVLGGANGNSGSGFETLRVWSWSGDTVQESAAWTPFPNAKIYKTLWAAMPRDDVILTVGGDKELTAWSFPNPKANYALQLEDHQPPLLSPGGKYLIVRSKEGHRFHETATGKLVGQTDPAEGLSTTSLSAFHPEGHQLASLCVNSDSFSGWKAYVWDLKTGKLSAESDVVDPNKSHIQFCEPPFLLAGNTLIDLERNASVWKYQYMTPAVTPPDSRLWFCAARRGDYRTYVRSLPSAEERSKIDAAWSNISTVIASGAALSVEVQVPADAPPVSNQQALVQKASQRLEEAGYRSAPDQAQRLRVIVVEGGTGQMVEFRRLFGNEVVAKVPDRRLEVKVALVDHDDKEVWSRTGSFGPQMMVTRLEPADANDLVNAIMRKRWEQMVSWLDYLQLPNEIRSTMTDAGIGLTEIKADP
jgi:hypothetical protein